jgi:glycosyltransferase involved in cell wall biosynthesis
LRAVRVLTVGNMYPPHHYGGYELLWESAVEHMRRGGHEVEVLTTDTRTGATDPDPAHVHRELRWHLRDARFDRLSPRGRLAIARHNHRALERHLERLRPDVVSWWAMGGLTLTMLESVRRAGLPAVAFVIDDWLDYGPYVDPWLSLFTGPRRGRLAPLGARVSGLPTSVDFPGAATYVFCSDYTRSRAASVGHVLPHTGLVHPGIDPAYLDPAPERDWGWRLLYLGRLDPRKGIETAVEALTHLPDEAVLDILGGWDRNEEARLREVAARLGVADRTHFAGHRGRDELVAAYADADAVLFPVVWEEPWGLVPLEAMGRGRPVIATGRGGSKEYLRDGENCLLFEAEDARALAAAVRRLAGDGALRARLREGGLSTAPHYTQPLFNEAVEDAVARAAGAVAAAVP